MYKVKWVDGDPTWETNLRLCKYNGAKELIKKFLAGDTGGSVHK